MEKIKQLVISRDIQLFHFFYKNFKCSFLDKFMTFITHLGGTAFCCLFITVLFLSGSKVSREIFVALTASHLLVHIIKRIANRPRPCNVLKNITTLVVPLEAYSFPSGHTTAGFSLAVTLTLTYPAYGIYFLLIAALIGISRIYIGVHYPSDIIIGAMIGSIFSLFIHNFVFVI